MQNAFAEDWKIVGADMDFMGVYRSIDVDSIKVLRDGNIEYAIKYSGHKDWNRSRTVIANCGSQKRQERMTPNDDVLMLGIYPNTLNKTELDIACNVAKSVAPDQAQELARLRAEAELANQRQKQVEERLRIEAQAATQRQRELEEQLKQSQPQPIVTAQSTTSYVGKRVALVIGNASYKIHPLRNPRNDADDISRSLKGNGFEVIDLRDASLSQMRSAIRQFGDKLLTSDAGLVYYSGHGIEVRGRNYFIPINADIQREDEVADQSFDVSLILEKMSTAQKAVNILIVDACRDDPFGRSFRSGSKGLASMEAPRGTIVAYATSPGKVAADGDGRNSPYTKHLVRAMQAPNKPIELVFKEVRRAVQDETKYQQTPWENTSLSGDFYFKVQK